jgi:ribosomal protein L23
MSDTAAKKVNLSVERLHGVIGAPIITEKATLLSEFNQVCFRVPLDATKPEIKAAIEQLFKVKVTAVNTNQPPQVVAARLSSTGLHCGRAIPLRR